MSKPGGDPSSGSAWGMSWDCPSGIRHLGPRIEAIRIVDMSSSNSWAEFAALFRNTRGAFLDHERAKGELKSLTRISHTTVA
jgi:hypothetical protein